MASYAEKIKRDFLSEIPKKPCCRRALTFGLLFFLDMDGTGVWLPSEVAKPYLLRAIPEQFGRECQEKKGRGRRVQLLFDTEGLLAKRDAFLKKPSVLQLLSRPCDECMTAFLRGMFVSIGHVIPPEKGYGLEFTPRTLTEQAATVLTELGFSPRRAKRLNNEYLYIRQSAQIEDYLARLGAPEEMFSFMNEKISRELRNSANRIASCESNNIARSISAAGEQIDLIERLVATDKLSLLPKELQSAARARLENREASLAHLAANMVPPLTKSGMNHRLQKIVSLAKQMLNEEA